MADFFLSYARDDEPTASRFAKMLENSGVSVWWDRSLVAGERYNEVIDRELEKAEAIIVLWSSKSVVSDWVLGEATTARESGKLAPIKIEDCKLPIPFRAFHTPEVYKNKAELHDMARLLSEKHRARSGAGPQSAPKVKISDASATSFLSSLGSQWENYSEATKRYQDMPFRERLRLSTISPYYRDLFKKSPLVLVGIAIVSGIIGVSVNTAASSQSDLRDIWVGLAFIGICAAWYIWHRQRKKA